MRIAFLFDPALTADDPLHFVFHQWLNGLTESQNQIKVLARRDSRSLIGPLNEKVEWAEPARTWAWWELPKILAALLPFAPDVIHIVLSRQPKVWQFWPAITQMPGPPIPVVVSLADGWNWPKGWGDRVRFLSPQHSGPLAVPGLTDFTASQGANDGTIFIPGPLLQHLDWRKTVATLRRILPQRSDWKIQLGWQWSDIDLPERLSVRSEWLQAVPTELVKMQTATLANQLQVLRHSNLVVLAPLKNSWTRSILEQTARAYGIARLDHGQDWSASLLNMVVAPVANEAENTRDSAINQLVRTYHQLLVE